MKRKCQTESYCSLKEAVHDTFGSQAQMLRTDRVHGGDINDAYKITLSTGERVFVKTNSIGNARFFITEAHGLSALRQTEAIKVPRVLGIGVEEEKGISFLLLEYLESAPSGKDYWEVFGHQLATLHKAVPLRKEEAPLTVENQKAGQSCSLGKVGGRPLKYGFTEDNFIGSSPQKNLPMETWIDFYRECRLMPQIKMAESCFDSGMKKKMYYLLDHLDSYLREPEFPSLLHGDLWSGNVLCGPDGKAWILDPAVYVGDFEADLAMTQLFGSFPAAFYAAYDEVNPIDKGYSDRKDLYHLYHLLNHLNLFGRMYLGSVVKILNRYG
ncbi:MAG: fructosamine kinase family protein [Lachnospiraceae bacterium]|nr:fructosamine kinase family protein [Lachnospiraceae bacterium]